MRAIKAKGNKSTEVRFRLMLVRTGLRGWRVHPKGIAGRPDFYFPEERLALFVDGCFWHGCPKCGHVPKANNPYWKAKIEGNRCRDLEYVRKLQEEGILALRFWEHELREEPMKVIEAIKDAMNTETNQARDEAQPSGENVRVEEPDV
jgi:DNA mismatch endonuclease Vsr